VEQNTGLPVTSPKPYSADDAKRSSQALRVIRGVCFGPCSDKVRFIIAVEVIGCSLRVEQMRRWCPVGAKMAAATHLFVAHGYAPQLAGPGAGTLPTSLQSLKLADVASVRWFSLVARIRRMQSGCVMILYWQQSASARLQAATLSCTVASGDAGYSGRLQFW
jgi:hypothetical protein